MLVLPFVCLIRPFQDELFMSDPKRAALDSPVSVQSPKASDSRKVNLDSAADLFPGQSEGGRDSFSPSVQAEQNNRKRNGTEEENIAMDELESIMSLDMDYFDELPADENQQDQTLMQSWREKKRSGDAVEAPSARKRQRLHFEDGTDRRQQCDAQKEDNSEKPEQPAVSIKTEEPHLSERGSTYGELGKHPQSSSSPTHTNMKAFKDIEVKRCLRLESNHVFFIPLQRSHV